MAEKHHDIVQSRAQFSCSESLGTLLHEVNLVPPGLVIPYEKFWRRSGKVDLVACENFYGSLPKELRTYLDESDQRKRINEIYNRNRDHVDNLKDRPKRDRAQGVDGGHAFLVRSKYLYGCLIARSYRTMLRRLINARKMFDALIELAESNQDSEVRPAGNLSMINQDIFAALDKEEVEDRISGVAIYLDSNYQITFGLAEWATLLQGVDIRRIRKCEVCSRYFWAARKDAFTCSKQHAKVRQMRLLRKKWQENGDLYLKARKKRKSKQKEK